MRSISPAKIHSVAVGDGYLHVVEKGDGQPVLFIHGWTLDLRAFQPQLDALSNSFRLIAFDRRGFGQSTAPANLRGETEDVRTILDDLKIDRAHIVGMSQGGRIAIRFALTHPDRVRSLALQGTAVDGIEANELQDERIPLDHYVRLATSGQMEAVIEDWRRHPMMSTHGNSQAQIAIDAMLQDYRGNDLRHFSAESYRWDETSISRLRGIDVPVLLLTGKHDSAARQEIAKQLLELIPGSREHVFSNDGHLCNLTAPDEFNATLRAFLEDAGQ